MKMAFVRVFSLPFFLLLCLLTTTTTANAAEKQIDHGKALMEWLKSTKDGLFHDSLEIRPYQDSSYYYSMVATSDIAKDDVLLKIPRSLLVTAQKQLEVGERVRHFYKDDDDDYPGIIHAINKSGKKGKPPTFVIVDDDGDRQDDATLNDIEPQSFLCKTVQTLVKEMNLGDKSKLAPYIAYLKSQPKGQLPSAWSESGQNLLLEIVHNFDKEGQLLGPHDPFYHKRDFNEDCSDYYINNNMTSDVIDMATNNYMLLLQRGWDDLMIPVFDMMSHGNGHWLNTKIVGSVHDPDIPVTVQASRDILAGEEIYTTYNFCEDCEFRKLWYGTAELLRDYGFVEQFPQRWVFEDQDVVFDLEKKDDSDQELTLTFVEGHVLDDEQAPFFVEQLMRLEGLGETVFAKRDLNVPEYEWNMLIDYRQNLMTAIQTLLNNHAKDKTNTCTVESCDISSSRYYGFFYDRGNKEEFWKDDRPKTCHDYGEFGVSWWEFTEFIETPYQTIKFLENPTFDPTDTCFMLEQTWQICTSYRPHYHEMAVHYPARFLDEVKRVVFVGGGDSMLLHDVLKYPTLEKVVGLEIDQQVVRSSYRYFGTQPHFDDDRVEWWFGDAAKSLLMIPKEYFGSFDLVLVDLSETVAALSVTEDLDIMETLTLLVKNDGILLKNEYMYFPHQRKLFRDVLHIHFYNTPVVCSQSLILSSNGIDFMRGDFHEHDGVDPLMKLLAEPDVRHSISRDYQKNHTNPHTYCTNEKKDLTTQDQSPGITMIVEAEQTTAKIGSTKAIKDIVEKALKGLGFSVVTTVESSKASKLPVTVTVLREGYVVARAWPDEKYCAYDVHLWSSFEKHNDAKNALISAVGSTSSGSSAFRIVAGGMFGVSTWQDDEAKRGPKLEPCDETTSSDGAETSTETSNTTRTIAPDDIVVLTAVEESMGIVPEEEGEFVVAVLCGKEGTPCHALEAAKKSSRVADVIPVHSCATLVAGVEFLDDSVTRMLNCEKEIWKFLDSKVSASGADDDEKKIRTIVVDSSAERPFVSVFQSLCFSKLNQKRFFSESLVVVAPVVRLRQKWRSNFVNSFREKIYFVEPSFKSDVVVNSTITDATTNETDPAFAVSIFSSGDILFFKRLSEFADRVETKSEDIVVEIDNVRGGDFLYQDPFEYKEIFTDSDFDQTSAVQQWESQKSLGLQVVLQFDQNKLLSITWEKIKTGIETVLTGLLPNDEKATTEEIQGDKKLGGGEGGILVAFWSGGHAAVVWDGRLHVDINLFLYTENFDFVEQLETKFTKDELQGLTRSLRDMHPRGTGRVMNFAKDVEEMKISPSWLTAGLKQTTTSTTSATTAKEEL